VRSIRNRASLAPTPIIVSESCLDSAFLEGAGAGANGVYASGPDVGALRSGGFYTTAFLPAYERAYGGAPGSTFHSYAFDATNLIFDALRRTAEPLPSGGLRIRRSELRAAMLAVQGYPGVSGPLSCRPTGDCAQGARLAI
jgi:branched-chain amino acid transport system substrate-binding protein